MKPKSNTQDFINKANVKHNNFFDYSKTVYVNSKQKVIIIDPEYGEFMVTPNHHLKGVGHPQRAIDNRNKGNTLTQKEVIQKFIEMHGNTYDYSKVIYENMQTKVCVVHPVHGEYWVKPYSHIQGHGHPSLSKSNYDINRPGYLYIHKIELNGNVYYKFGKTNNYDQRLTDLNYNNKSKAQSFKVFHSTDGRMIERIEQQIKSDSTITKAALSKEQFKLGYTETIHAADLDKVLAIIDSYDVVDKSN